MGRLTRTAAATITGLLLLATPAHAQSGIEKVFDNAEKVGMRIGSSVLLLVVFFVGLPLLSRSKVGGIIVLIGCTLLLGGMIVAPEAWWDLIRGTTNRLLRGA